MVASSLLSTTAIFYNLLVSTNQIILSNPKVVIIPLIIFSLIITNAHLYNKK